MLRIKINNYGKYVYRIFSLVMNKCSWIFYKWIDLEKRLLVRSRRTFPIISFISLWLFNSSSLSLSRSVYLFLSRLCFGDDSKIYFSFLNAFDSLFLYIMFFKDELKIPSIQCLISLYFPQNYIMKFYVLFQGQKCWQMKTLKETSINTILNIME